MRAHEAEGKVRTAVPKTRSVLPMRTYAPESGSLPHNTTIDVGAARSVGSAKPAPALAGRVPMRSAHDSATRIEVGALSIAVGPSAVPGPAAAVLCLSCHVCAGMGSIVIEDAATVAARPSAAVAPRFETPGGALAAAFLS